jgi:hypothetical protein
LHVLNQQALRSRRILVAGVETLSANAKRPATELSASGVNWWAGQIRCPWKSSPRLTLPEPYRARERETFLPKLFCRKNLQQK